MQLLEDFQPRLVGSVLDGTASAHSRIALHVFADAVESLILFLLERGAAFAQEQRQIPPQISVAIPERMRRFRPYRGLGR